MKCYYEILQVDREADDNEIKTAYRKLALKWHPDKNLENTELAKEEFQLIQQAYDVLSDRQERAWYDKHRESILRGANSEYKDEFLDVFQYFTTSCFKGYGDDEEGFYTVYGKVFDKLIEEDMKFINDKEDFINIPQFGKSSSDYEEVVRPFYDYWMSYNTKKSFTWLDLHDVRSAGNRRVLKILEKENEKIRQKAKKERNEEVRNLVAFVRKRDKRVQTHIKFLESKKIENREKQQRLTKEKKLQRIQQLNDSGNQAEWMKFDNVKSQLEEVEKALADQFDDLSSNSDESYVEEDINNLYCIACNKMFKNANAFRNHESSKKHKEKVSRLKESMLDDNLEENSNSDLNIDESPVESVSDVEVSSLPKSKKKNKSKKNKNILKPELTDEEDLKSTDLLPETAMNDNHPEEDQISPVKPKREKQKKKKTKESAHNTSSTISSKKEINSDLCCAKCRSEFPSKNKLFDHLKKTGHSVALPSQVNKSKPKKDERKKC